MPKFDITSSENYWSNTEKSLSLVSKIVFPKLKRVRHIIGCQDDHVTLIITDTFKEQDNDAIANLCTDNNCALVIVPHNWQINFSLWTLRLINLLNVLLVSNMVFRASRKLAKQRGKLSRGQCNTEAIRSESTAFQVDPSDVRASEITKRSFLMVSGQLVLPNL